MRAGGGGGGRGKAITQAGTGARVRVQVCAPARHLWRQRGLLPRPRQMCLEPNRRLPLLFGRSCVGGCGRRIDSLARQARRRRELSRRGFAWQIRRGRRPASTAAGAGGPGGAGDGGGSGGGGAYGSGANLCRDGGGAGGCVG
eukprot:scaffold2409_cov121-Isochrysis_galbana.AAC.1